MDMIEACNKIEVLESANSDLQKRVEELGKLDDMVVCPDCGSIDRSGNWPLANADSDDGKVTCLECGEDVEAVTTITIVQRIRDLESQLSRQQAANHCIAHTDESIQTILDENQTLKAKCDELEAEVSGLKELLQLTQTSIPEDGLLEHAKLAARIKTALSTPTGSKLMAKVEAFDRMSQTNSELNKLCDDCFSKNNKTCTGGRSCNIRKQFASNNLLDNLIVAISRIKFDLLANMFDKAIPDDKNPEIQRDLRNAHTALSAYRAACEESEAGK